MFVINVRASAILFTSSPTLIAYGSKIIIQAPPITINVPIFSNKWVFLQKINLKMVNAAPWEFESKYACD